jgi:hypothetical protein
LIFRSDPTGIGAHEAKIGRSFHRLFPAIHLLPASQPPISLSPGSLLPVHLGIQFEIMETQNTNPAPNPTRNDDRWSMRDGDNSNNSGRVFGGIVVLTVGAVILLDRLGFGMPYWLLSWPMILIAVGIFLGVRHGFRGPAWIILITVGSIFLIDRIDHDIDFHRFIWPTILIAVGLVLIFRPKKKKTDPFATTEGGAAIDESNDRTDFIDSVIIFGGVKKQIISKTFRGGKLTTIFGGTELNLSQADVTGRIEIDLTQIFGGTKLIVPPHWRVQSDELVNIFGGLDDKRPIQVGVAPDMTKVIVIKGTCIFGGIDIKSY